MSPQELERIKLLEKIKSKKTTQVEAARLLDLSESQVIRLCQEYKKFERCRHYFKSNNPKINLNAFLILVAAASTCAQNQNNPESSDNDQLSTIIPLSFLSIPMIVLWIGALRHFLCQPVPRPTDGVTAPQGEPDPDDLSIPSSRSSFSSASSSPDNELGQISPNNSQAGDEESNLPHP